jgi:hypothetical protein
MTRDEILNMPAGREMDKLIAAAITNKKNIRWISFTKDWGCDTKEGYIPGKNLGWELVPQYSTRMSDAWEVAEVISPKYLWFQVGIEHLPNGEDTCGWEVVIYNIPDQQDRVHVSAATAPLAICRAVLLSVCEREAGGGEG